MLTRWPHNRLMFGPSITTVFASRWRALWFVASVMLTAYCSIPDAADTPADDAASQQQVDIVMKNLEKSADNLKQFNQR
jgi:hypothetical protein